MKEEVGAFERVNDGYDMITLGGARASSVSFIDEGRAVYDRKADYNAARCSRALLYSGKDSVEMEVGRHVTGLYKGTGHGVIALTPGAL